MLPGTHFLAFATTTALMFSLFVSRGNNVPQIPLPLSPQTTESPADVEVEVPTATPSTHDTAVINTVPTAVAATPPALAQHNTTSSPYYHEAIPLQKHFGRLVLLGDSIASEASRDDKYPKSTYLKFALEALLKEGYNGTTKTHIKPGFGLSDWLFYDLQETILNEVLIENATAFVIQIGINDALKQLSPVHATALYWSVVNLIRDRCRDCTILLLTITPCEIFNSMYDEWTHAFNIALRELATTFRAIVAPTGETLLDAFINKAQRRGGTSSMYYRDTNCHPNGRGKKVMANALVKAVLQTPQRVVLGSCREFVLFGYIVRPVWKEMRCDMNAPVEFRVSTDGRTLTFMQLPVEVTIVVAWAVRPLQTTTVTATVSSNTTTTMLLTAKPGLHAEITLSPGTTSVSFSTDTPLHLPYYSAVYPTSHPHVAVGDANTTFTVPPIDRATVRPPILWNRKEKAKVVVIADPTFGGTSWHDVAGLLPEVASARARHENNTDFNADLTTTVHYVNGTTTWAGQSVVNIVMQEAAKGANLFVLSIGEREGMRGVSASTTVALYRHMVNVVRRIAPEAVLILTTLASCKPGLLPYQEWTSQVNLGIAEAAVTFRCVVADTGDVLRNALNSEVASLSARCEPDSAGRLLVAETLAAAVLSQEKVYSASVSCGIVYFSGNLLRPKWPKPGCETNPTVRMTLHLADATMDLHGLQMKSYFSPAWAHVFKRQNVYGLYQFQSRDVSGKEIGHVTVDYGMGCTQTQIKLKKGTHEVASHLSYKFQGKRLAKTPEAFHRSGLLK